MNHGNDGEGDVGPKRARYSAEYRAEALSLAERVGVAAVASALGLYAPQIYQWRSKAAHERGVSDRERELREENARPKRQLGWAGCIWQWSSIFAPAR